MRHLETPGSRSSHSFSAGYANANPGTTLSCPPVAQRPHSLACCHNQSCRQPSRGAVYGRRFLATATLQQRVRSSLHSQHLGIAGWLNPGALSVGQQGALAERHERREHRCSARAQCSRLVAAAAAGEAPPPAFAEAFRSVMQQVQMGLQGLTQPIPTMGAALTVAELAHHPPGAAAALVEDVSMQLPANQLGLVYGKSGAGKSTLLYLLAGLLQPTQGTITLTRSSASASPPEADAGRPKTQSATPMNVEVSSAQQRRAHVGMVFQFPERHFLGATVVEELTFTWPRQNLIARQALAQTLPAILRSTGLQDVPLQQRLSTLSGGQQRRVALAVALARRPSLLLLDEPLAGLDWRSRAGVASVLRDLKRECTMLVVSHDLKELSKIVDCAWEMRMGGKLHAAPWPPMPNLTSAPGSML